MHAPDAIKVLVSPDEYRATVHIPGAFDRAYLTSELLRVITAEARVEIGKQVEARLGEIVAHARANAGDIVADLAMATEASHGTDGTWAWEKGFGPDCSPADQSVSERTDHYSSRILTVQAGVRVASVTPPTPGTDGRTVTGAVIRARPGKPARPSVGEGLEARPDGAVVTRSAGVLRVTRDTASVAPSLEIPANVDFSTGNIDFSGDVVIRGGICDAFRVRAGGNIDVAGPVEGAVIDCGAGLSCPRGIASSRRAEITAGADSNVGFMRNVHALFRSSLICRGECANSHVIIGGEFHCETGRVIGGVLVLTGPAFIGTLGSPDWLPTLVSVGDLPLVNRELRRLGAEAARVRKLVEAKEEELRHMQGLAAGKSASARERVTELQYEISEQRERLVAIEAERGAIVESSRQAGPASLHVGQIVYPRVRIQHGANAVEFERELKGPLQFVVDEHGTMMVRVGSAPPRPVTDFAKSVAPTPIMQPPEIS